MYSLTFLCRGRTLTAGFWLAVVLASSPLFAGPPSVVMLETGDRVYRGRSLAHDKHYCWLVEPTGWLHRVTLKDVVNHKNEGTPFRAESVATARDRLARAAPRGMEVKAQGRYVVMAPTGQATTILRLLNQVYGDFYSFFSRRQITLREPEFPLVVSVFANREEFVAHAATEQTLVSPALKGYYHRRSNRISVYQDGTRLVSHESRESGSEETLAAIVGESFESISDTRLAATIEGNLRATLIHEATHQLAFNAGLHPRSGDVPQWMSEGLAMLFEEDSRRDDGGGRNPSARVHRNRYIWFQNYLRERRPKQALATFIASDALFREAALDAYSEAWALSFYLIENRRADYANYMVKVSSRDPFKPYSAEERLADFQSCFGKDLAVLEMQYLQFIKRLDP